MSNVIKFQAPFERIKNFNVSPDISLRKAIITQAIIDATNISEDKEAKAFEKEAKNWIFGGNDYFKEICNEAGIEPSFVIKITKQVIKLHRSNKAKKLKGIQDKFNSSIKIFRDKVISKIH